MTGNQVQQQNIQPSALEVAKAIEELAKKEYLRVLKDVTFHVRQNMEHVPMFDRFLNEMNVVKHRDIRGSMYELLHEENARNFTQLVKASVLVLLSVMMWIGGLAFYWMKIANHDEYYLMAGGIFGFIFFNFLYSLVFAYKVIGQLVFPRRSPGPVVENKKNN